MTTPTPTPAPIQVNQASGAAGGLLDMIGSAPAQTPATSAPTALSAAAPTTVAAMVAQHPPPNGEPIVFLEEPDSIKIIGGVLKNGSGKTQCTVHFLNNSGSPIENLKFQLAVPKYIQMNMKTPSSTSVPPGGLASQVVQFVNTEFPAKPLLVKSKTVFTTNGSNQDRAGNHRFPDGC
jgi:hypothetical protein